MAGLCRSQARLGQNDCVVLEFLELSGLPVLSYVVPGEIAAVHRYIDPWWKHLGKGQGAAEVEESIGAAEFIRDHGAGEDNGLSRYFFSQHPGCDRHSVCAMRDNDLVVAGGPALMRYQFPVLVGHVEAVDHHKRSYGHVKGTPAALKHFGQVGLLKKELPGEFIVLFVESAAGYKYADGHNE